MYWGSDPHDIVREICNGDPKIAMASFDPMNLLQVFAPRYNTPSIAYQGGIGFVNLSFHDLWHKQGTN